MINWIILFLLIPSLCFSDSETTIGGKTASAHIIQASGDSLRPRPYLDFEGCTGADVGGKTVITCSGGGGSGSGTVTSVATSNGITGGTITTTGTISGVNAASNGSTKGVAAFNATNFSCTTGVCNTIQDIASSSSPSFTNLSLSGVLNMSSQQFLWGTFSGSGTAANVFLGVGAGSASATYNNNTGLGSGALTSIGAAANKNVAVGNTSMNGLTSGTQNVAVGTDSCKNIGAGGSNVCVGNQAGLGENGNNNVFIGNNAGQVGSSTSTILIGSSSVSGSHSSGIALGQNATLTADNQMVIGDSGGTSYITDFYLGGGARSSFTHDITIHATDAGNNSNTVGYAMTLAGGRSTGTALGGSILLQTTPAGTTGSSLNSGVTRLTLDGAGLFTMWDGGNLALGSTTGSDIGTATTQKLGFYGATPVVQQLATTDLGTTLSNLGLRASGTAYPITTSGTVNLSGLTLTTPLALDGSKNVISGSYSGNTTQVATVTGSKTSGSLTKFDASGNVITAALIPGTLTDGKVCTYTAAGTSLDCNTSASGTGTVTNTGGSLTSNSVVLGAGTNDTKVVAGITTDGASVLNLGVNTTTLGKVKMFGNTSGDATIQPAAVAGTATVVTLPNASSTLPIFGQQITFSGPSAARTITLPDASITVARTDAANTFTGHQTIEGVTSTGATGTGKFVFDGSPTLVTPTIGAAVGTSLTLSSPGTSSTDVANLSSTNTYTNKTMSYAVASGAGTYKGNILTLTSTETQAIGDVVQINSSGQAHLAKADVIANASGVLLAAAAVSGSASNTYLLPGGTLKLSSSPSWTVGGLVYLTTTGTTGNTLTQTAPSGTNNVIQILGVAVAADTILFMPSLSQVEHV